MLDQRTFNVDTFCNESTHDEIKEIVYKKGLKSGIFPARGGGGVWVAIYWSHFRQKFPFVQPAQLSNINFMVVILRIISHRMGSMHCFYSFLELAKTFSDTILSLTIDSCHCFSD